MTSYLLDTNHAAKIMASEEQIQNLIVRQAQKGDLFFTCVIVLGELYFAAHASSRRAFNLRNIENLLAHIPMLDFDRAAAEEYGRIKAELKAKGRPIPGTDAQIAAIARLHGLTILSADRHFRFVDGLTVENWLG